MMKIYIVVVSYFPERNLQSLIDMLISNERQIDGVQIKIVIVDNTPTRKNKIKISKIFKKCDKTFLNKENLGYAKAANIGIKYALQKKADGIIIMNQDITIKNNLITDMIRSKTDIASPILKFRRDNKWIYDFGGRVSMFTGRTYHIETEEKSLNYVVSRPDYVSGCCMYIDTKVFNKIGLFDENFFMYYEDVDFCLRARDSGFDVAVLPTAEIIHHLQEGSLRSFQKYGYMISSYLYFLRKHISFLNLLAYISWMFFTIKIILYVNSSRINKLITNSLKDNETIGSDPNKK